MNHPDANLMPRAISHSTLAYVAECFGDASELIADASRSIEFWRVARDVLGLMRLRLVKASGQLLLLLEGRNEVLLGEPTPFHTGGALCKLYISSRSLKGGRSKFERRLHEAMRAYGIDMITIFYDEKGTAITLNKVNRNSPWHGLLSLAPLSFSDLTVDNILAATFGWACSEINEVLSFASYAARPKKRTKEPVPEGPSTGGFNTDENPCEVGFESF